jgi:RNA polymerase sigma-70 factor (ECF subfamily)
MRYRPMQPREPGVGLDRRERREPDPFHQGLLDAIPRLRAFAFSLVGTRRHDRADDLVQETIMKAWAHRSSFQPGTNLKAWLHTILRNEFYSQMRRKKREVEDGDGVYSSKLAVAPDQYGHLDMADMEAALEQLADEQREAILLVGAAGFSYEDAAQICGVAIGTIKSRVNRARTRLAELLKVSGEIDYSPDSTHWAAISTLALQQ